MVTGLPIFAFAAGLALFAPSARAGIVRDRAETLAWFLENEWLSLIAPRGLAVGSGAEDKWAGPAGEQAAARKASEAWKAAGKPNGILFFLREGGHALTHGDWARYLDFADSCFSQHVNGGGLS